ncbi:MAG: adenine deaminase C-terminal domain-containing protein [Syntrophorhabdaceae bacterium]|nr:amidohydrolase family protein [Syntrophorhabdaceae bacterium]MDD4196732.1 adenine deaminase C-terminal domain-containing protein [Syntrophorhabdaceae bacterium]
MKAATIRSLLDVTKGKAGPDAIIVNGKIINVFTNGIDEGSAIIIKDGLIASIEDEDKASGYSPSEVVDARGAYLCPGFIDAHTHLDSLYPFYALVPYAVRGGTTTVVTETSAVACACGMEGVASFTESTQGYPVRCYFLAPPLTPPFPEMEGSKGLTLGEFKKFLKRDDVVGIGEAYWTRIVEGDPRILKQAEAALGLNKKLDGHAAGAHGKRLIEYALTGITSCHESITVDEVLEKLRFGIYIMIRQGFVRKELPELSGLKDMDIDTRRLILTSDAFDAVMLREEGYLDSIVRTAISYGFRPIDAIKMATINPADYYGLRHLGAIAPLRHADILFLNSMEDVWVERVMAGGKMVFDAGQYCEKIEPYNYPDTARNTIKARKISPVDLKVAHGDHSGDVRVIKVLNQTITREISWKPLVKNGYLEKDLSADIIPVSVINRYNSSIKGKGFITGTGIKQGAFATSLIWDTGNILTMGSSEDDMATAVNSLIDLQGGTVIVREGSVIFELPMPVFGTIPIGSIEEIADATQEMVRSIRRIGVTLERPFLTLQTIPFSGLPFLRITDKGLADIKNRRLVPLHL